MTGNDVQKKYQIKLLVTICFLLALLAIFELSGLRQNLNLDYLKQSFENNLQWGGLIFISLFCLGNLIQIPGWIFLASAVITLGQFHGGLITYFAAVISCIVTYSLIGFLGQDALRDIQSPMAKRIFSKLDKYPVLSVFSLRTIFQTAPVLNYSLALSGVKFRNYLLGTILGLPIPIFVYCLFFDFLTNNVLMLNIN